MGFCKEREQKRKETQRKEEKSRMSLAALVIYWIPESSSVKGSLCYCMKPEIRITYYFILGLRGDLKSALDLLLAQTKSD